MLLISIHFTFEPCECDSHIDCCQKTAHSVPQSLILFSQSEFCTNSERTKLCFDHLLRFPFFLLASPTSYHPGLPLTVRVRFCGIIEGSVARAHGLHWGWLKALTLFAYQMPCGRENTDLHGRKPTDRPGDSVSLLRSQGPRGTFASHACMSVCVCVCVCVRAWQRRPRRRRAFF